MVHYRNIEILQYLKKMIFQALETLRIGLRNFFYISERHEIKHSIDIIFVWLGKVAELKMQITHFHRNIFLYAAARQLLLNSFDKLAELHLESYIAYFRVLEEPFEIWPWKFLINFCRKKISSFYNMTDFSSREIHKWHFMKNV